MSPPPIILIDESEFPLVVITCAGRLDAPSLAHNIAFYKRVFLRGERFSVVFDARQAERPPADINQAMQRQFKALEADLARHCLGVGYVLNSVLLRMVLRGFLLAVRPPHPTSVHASVAAARAWCLDQLIETARV